jgi:outer membrane protein OmpA-like peptidoglycan-associated protein
LEPKLPLLGVGGELMNALYARKSTIVLGAAALVLVGTGCATKKHVRSVVAPVEARVGEVEKTTKDHASAIGEIENNVSRVDERAMDADKKAVAAGQAAQAAQNRADQAFGQAGTAQGRADSAHQLAETTRSRLTSLAENIDNYKLVTTENVLFGLEKAALTDESKQQLDSAVGQLATAKNYVLEIQGFTDATGSPEYNLQLSRRRADAVVRYLTTQHNVPLRKISVLGIGEDDPTADNTTRDGRKVARRVEVKVFALDLGSQGGTTAATQATDNK